MYYRIGLAALIVLIVGTSAYNDAPPTTLAAKVRTPPVKRQLQGMSIIDSLDGPLGDSGTASSTSMSTATDSASASASTAASSTFTSPTALPSPTGSPSMYPDEDDCADSAWIGSQDDGATKWKSANATYTLDCYDTFYRNNQGYAQDPSYNAAMINFFGLENGADCGFGKTCGYDGRCQDLVPLPLVASKNLSSKLEPDCRVTDYRVHWKSTGWVVIDSLANYNTYLTLMWDQIDQAARNVDKDMTDGGDFISNFSGKAEDDLTPMKDGLVGLTAALGAIAGAIGIFTAGVLEPVAAAIVAAGPAVVSTITSSAISGATANMTAAQNPDNMLQWWYTLRYAVEGGYSAYQDAIFSKGWVWTNATENQVGVNHTLINIIDGGTWAGTNVSHWDITNQTALDLIEQTFYAQMAQTVWTKSAQMTPFISVWKADDCTDESKFPPNFMYHWKQGQSQQGHNAAAMNWSDVTTTRNNDCFALLGAEPGTCTDANNHHTQCCMWDVLPSGTHTALNGSKWSGLLLDDMLQSAILGFEAAGKRNGYNQTDLINTVFAPGYPHKLSDAGIVNYLPICDYGNTPKAPGINCPNTMNIHAASCSF